MAGPTAAERGADPAAAELRRFVRRGDPYGIDRFPTGGWRLLYRDPRAALFGHGKPGRVNLSVHVVLGNGRWRADDWGDCQPRRFIEGSVLADWSLQRGERLEASTRTLPLVVVAYEPCSAFPQDLQRVEVRESRRFVDVIVVLRRPGPLPPGYACTASATLVPARVILPHALGRRVLRDVTTAPAVRVADPSRR
jgi:hypothetical protein